MIDEQTIFESVLRDTLALMVNIEAKTNKVFSEVDSFLEDSIFKAVDEKDYQGLRHYNVTLNKMLEKANYCWNPEMGNSCDCPACGGYND